MMKIIERLQVGVMALGLVLAASLIVTPIVAAEEKTVDAFAPFEGQGKVYVTGENKATFVGALVGQLFVDSGNGPLHAGRIVCPAMLQLDLRNGKQAGSGQCTITAEDGTQIFAVWSCRGVHLVGCDGEMMLTGGTGRTAGVSGHGPLTVRTISRGLMKTSSDQDSVITFGRGVLVLRGFKFNNPSK